MITSGHGRPHPNWGEQGDSYVDSDANVLWVKYPHGWCDVINNRHLSETGGFYAPVIAMNIFEPAPVKQIEPSEQKKGRVFDFE